MGGGGGRRTGGRWVIREDCAAEGEKKSVAAAVAAVGKAREDAGLWRIPGDVGERGPAARGEVELVQVGEGGGP